MSLASKFNLQRWNFTIRTKLAVLITLLIAGISLFIFVYFPFRLENQAVKGIVHEAESITEMTAFHVGPGLFFEDLEAIEEAFKGAQKNRDLIYMVVMNNSGQVFAAFNRKEANRSNFAQTTDNQHISQDGMIYRTTTPILNNGEKIGQFYLGLSLEELRTQVSRSRTTIALVSLLIFISGMVAVFVISTVITNPLSYMVETVKRVEEGDLTQRTTISSQDEVGHLARSFNLMVAHIEERTEELQQEISERKQAEEARRKAENALEGQKALSMRADRLRSLGEMAAGIAHELNQPLVGVRGLAEHMLIGIDRGWELTQDKFKERLTNIIEQADRMVHIIQHVRMFAREAGKPIISEISINDVVISSLDMIDTQFRSHGVDLKTELGQDLSPVQANPYSLEEVLLNLLNNARDAVEERAQNSDASPARVCVRTAQEDGCVRIEVEDNGVGVPQEILEKLFDPFFTTKDPDKGTGLGVSISKSIVEDFGGDVKVESTLGQGTTVTIDLPVGKSPG